MMKISPYFMRLLEWLGWIGLAYVCCVALLFMLQRNLMYYPDPVPFDPAKWAMPELKPLDVVTKDNLNLRSWYLAPRGESKVTVVFLQGNGGHLGLRNYKIRSWIDSGFGVLLVGYRGYGNPGQPSEEGLYADARASIEALTQKGTPVEKMALYGESLGTGIAVQMAKDFPDTGALILESAYSSMVKVGTYHYPFIPVKLMLRDRYDSLAKITFVHAPLLLLHGEADRMVPVKQGRRLFEAANEPKQAAFIPGVGHNDIYGPSAQQTVLAFLTKISKRR